jgi:transposase
LTGLAILDALLAGERDPAVLAQHRDPRLKASPATLAKALVGDYRPEHLFTLRQAVASFRHYQRLVAVCDQEVQRLLDSFPATEAALAAPLPPDPRPRPRRFAPQVELRTELYRILGVDLTQVPGFATLPLALFAELGPTLAAFPSSKHFASWLGLCPDNRISGGQVLAVQTRHVKHRVAQALRTAAQSLHRSQSALGAYFRRMRAKLGAPKAITATAHKLARIIYHLITTRQPYDESRLAAAEADHRRHSESRLRAQARVLGFQLVPIAGQSVS